MTLPTHVGIRGGGRMGAGIAHAFLVSGTRVTIIEIDNSAAAAATDRVTASLGKAAQRGLLDNVSSILDRLAVATNVHALADAELVIEAVPEDTALKVAALTEVAEVAPQAVLATNTSSLSIDVIAQALPDPTRLIGLHFFNPVPASDLVEIVIGERTDPDIVRSSTNWIGALGKTAISVTDSPGFASSRLGVAIALEAIRMVEEGVASAEDIDLAMTLGYRHPTGPLRTTDIVGLDVRLAIAEHLAREVGARFEPPALLRDMVAAGRLGRKSGQGFYQW